MKYHITIWTDDGVQREFDGQSPAGLDVSLMSLSDTLVLDYQDTSGKHWFFNWNHVLGGTIKLIEEKK